MFIGYARVSSADRTLALQDALCEAKCNRILGSRQQNADFPRQNWVNLVFNSSRLFYSVYGTQ